LRKGNKMKYIPAFVLIAAMGALAIGCESSKKGTTEIKTQTTSTQIKDKDGGTVENKTQTTTTTLKDGKITNESKTTTETLITTPPVIPDDGGKTAEKTTETTK
jgi:hypothetical protein